MSTRIAVVDDDPDFVGLLKTVFKTRGYEVLTACDGEDGLQLIRSALPDLVILDLMMPKVSGLEVVRRMREDSQIRDIPVIVVSGIGEKTGKSEDFWRAGLKTEDFIGKGESFDVIALIGRVECVLRRKEYVSNYKQGAARGEGAAAVARPSLQNATPREIVRCFVEAWNSRNFGDEWTCLSDPMRGSIEKDEYVLRRQQAYAEEGAAAHRQRLVSVVEEELNGDGARALIEREDDFGARKSRRRERYSLRKTPDGWKIVAVRVLPK
jgi:CheY-like chemotaxis protein